MTRRPVIGRSLALWLAAAEAPALPLYQILKVDVVPARLAGVRPAAHAAPLTWNAADWRLVERPEPAAGAIGMEEDVPLFAITIPR